MKKLAVSLCFILIFAVGVQAKSITWDPNTEEDLAGYRVYLRDLPEGTWRMGADVTAGPDQTVKILLSDLGVTTEGHEYYVTAYDISGNESGPSNIINDVVPTPPGGCRIIK